jgi:hypothetical protein
LEEESGQHTWFISGEGEMELDPTQAAREKRERPCCLTKTGKRYPCKKHQPLNQNFKKRFSLCSAVNVIYWVTVVVNWIYRHSERIPHQIQQIVSRALSRWHDKDWDLIKAERSSGKSKIQSLQKSFPMTIKRNLSAPGREQVELHEESGGFYLANSGEYSTCRLRYNGIECKW